MTTDYTGTILNDKYHLDRKLGEGGMGAVYQGEHLLIGRKVAVKVLLSSLTQNEEAVKRFFREARAAATIGHPSIIDVLDVGVSSQGDPYLVMEYLEGEGLEFVLKRLHTLDLPTAYSIMEPVLQALKAAHAQGIIHRDIKPANIFVSKRADNTPQVKIIDFGVSKVSNLEATTQLTQDGTMLGTPAYMSPEQARGLADVDHRTDIYSIGVLFYNLLTGGLPYTGDTYHALLSKMLLEEPRPAQSVNPKFPLVAEPFIQKCMAKDRDDRYQNVDEMLEGLHRLVTVEQREACTTHLSGVLTTRSQHGVGTTTPPSGVLSVNAAELLSKVVREQQVLPKRSQGSGWNPLDRVPTKLKKVVGGSLALLALAAAFLFVDPFGEPAASSSVSITVDAVPSKSFIYFNNSLIPENPFKVKLDDQIAEMRVEAWGYSPAQIAIVPDGDQTIEVRLWPTASKQKPTVSITKDRPADDGESDTQASTKIELAPPPKKPLDRTPAKATERKTPPKRGTKNGHSTR